MFINELTSKTEAMTTLATPVPTVPRSLHRWARASLASVALTAVAITVNHLFALGHKALLLGLGLMVVPTALLLWFRRTKSPAALAGYLLMNLWIVVGFGLYKGLWNGALRLYLGTLLSSVSTSFPKPFVGRPWFEVSGVAVFIGALFVLYCAVQLVRAERARRRGSDLLPSTRRQRTSVAAGAILATIAIIAAYSYADCDRWVPPANGLVRIGVIVPTTGPYARLGGSFLKAVEMARDDLRGTKYRYELVVRDVGADPAKAREVIKQVVEEDKVDAIVGGISLIGQVTQPFARKARIPHACVCTVASIGDGAYSFTNIPSPEAEGVRWVTEARRRGIHRIAVLTQDYPSINNHVKAMEVEAGKGGLIVSYERRFDAATTDFRAAIAEARASRPDVYYIEALNPGLDLLAGQLKGAGERALSSVVAPSLSERPDLFEDAWYTDSNVPDDGFKERFEQRYPGTRFATHMMPYAYDSLNMLVQAFEQGRNPAVYLRELTSYDGTADRLTKQPGSGNFESVPAVWVMKGGKPKLLLR
jgi:ABC-type branched-subunit amino acid transport system substrate-binding protein